MATNQLAAASKKKEWQRFCIQREGKDKWECLSCKHVFTGGKTRWARHILGVPPGQPKNVKKCSAVDPEARDMLLKDVPLTVRDQVLMDIHSEPINMEEEEFNDLPGKMIENSSAGGVQSSITQWVSSTEKEECDMLLRKWAVVCRVHFRKLEHPYFRAYSKKVSLLQLP